MSGKHTNVRSGELIAQGARIRRIREKQKKNLILKIYRLEMQHKRSLVMQGAEDLAKTQEELRDLLDSQIQKSLKKELCIINNTEIEVVDFLPTFSKCPLTP